MCCGHMFVGIIGEELMARVGPKLYPDTFQQSYAPWISPADR